MNKLIQLYKELSKPAQLFILAVTALAIIAVIRAL